MTSVIKDDGKFYPQLFLEKALFANYACHPTRWDKVVGNSKKLEQGRNK